jgi:hypothetical protein
MARATFIAKASASNFVSALGVSVVAVLMGRTVTIHSVFVTAKLATLALNTREDVLHCEKLLGSVTIGPHQAG